MNVYFTEEGKRYHSNRECIKNSKKIYEKTEDEAKKKGKTKCLICYGKKNKDKQKILLKNNEKCLINSNDANDIIFNSSTMKNQKIFENDLILEKSINSINKITNIIKGNISKDSNDQSKISKNFDNNENINININTNEIINESNKNEESEEEEKEEKAEFTEDKKISINIKEEVENDKLNRKNTRKRNDYMPSKKIINKGFNNMENSKEEDLSFSHNLINHKALSSQPKATICGIGDMEILRETYENAIEIYYPDKNSFNISSNIEYFSKLQKGIYKYTFQLKDFKNNHIVELKVGFNISYENSSDLNFIDKKNINNINKKISYGTNGDELIISKTLLIGKDSDKIYAFINVKKGKFFIIGKNELNKRVKNVFLSRNNAQIFHVKNLGVLYYYRIEVEPIFIFDKKTSKNCTILFNGKKIN